MYVTYADVTHIKEEYVFLKLTFIYNYKPDLVRLCGNIIIIK